MAKELGKSVRELFASMGIYEFELWLHYYNECPFGDYRADLREALSCKILVSPYTKKNLSIDNFMLIPDEIEEKQELSTEDVQKKCFAYFGVIE